MSESKAIVDIAEKHLLKNENETETEPFVICDRATVMVISTKNREYANILKNYNAIDNINIKEIREKYPENTQIVSLSRKYLKDILKLLTKFKSETIKLKVANDFPISFIAKTDETEIILAPRIE